MKEIYEGYSCETNNKSDKIRINGYKIEKINKNEKVKWLIDSDLPLFDNVGKINRHKKVLIGEIDNKLYLISMMDQPKMICSIRNYKLYKARKFIWVLSDIPKLRRKNDLLISDSGSYLVNIKSGIKHKLESRNPPTESKVGKYKISNNIIKWENGRFIRETGIDIDRKEEINDMRKDKLEEYLENNVTFEIVKKSEYMNEVDRTETPMPIAKIFYEMGDGEYPKNKNGDFEPPDQHEFAICAYYKFKKLSDDSEAFAEEKKQAWIKRFKNSWSSLVRDVHFSFMANKDQLQDQKFDKVEFDLNKDIEEGVDLTIMNDGTEYQINLFVDSNKSRKFLDKKKNYRHDNGDSVEIEVPMKFDGEKKRISTNKQDLWLYNNNHLDGIKQIILEDKDEVIKDGKKICSVIKK